MISVPQSPVTLMLRSIVRCMSSNGSVRLPALCELNSRCSSSVRVIRSRWVELTVAVSPLTNLTSAQMWPFVWRQCLRTTPRAPDRLARTCMSRRRSMPILRLGFWSGARPRRWRGGTASVLRGFRRALRQPAQRFRRIRLPWALLCFRPCYGSASGVGCAALQKSSVAVDRQARDGCKQRSAELSALVFASVVCAKSRPKVKPGLRRSKRLSGARLVMDQRTLGA